MGSADTRPAEMGAADAGATEMRAAEMPATADVCTAAMPPMASASADMPSASTALCVSSAGQSSR